ncbi:DNA translocase FtsK [Vulgatibacter sp.]|uniref:DNA translocase FtsK n=1 Tax=Vulgatibacter sp. TaxID=1971226 RepID=UPI003565FF51
MERARESRLSLQGAKSTRSNRRLKTREPKKAPAKARRRESDKGGAGPSKLAGLAGDRREIVAVLFLAAALVSGLALGSWDPATSGNLIGRAGGWLARHLFGIFGIGAFVLPVSLFLGFLGLVRPEGKQPGLVVSVAWLSVLAGLAVFIELVAPTATFFGARPAGALGGTGADLLRRVFSTVGSAILVLAMLAVSLVIAAGVKWSRLVLLLGNGARQLGAWVMAFVRAQIEQHREEREARLAEEAAAEAEARAEEEAAAAAAFDEALGDLETELAEAKAKKKGRKKEEPGLEADLDGRIAVAPPEEAKPKVVLAPTAPPAKRDRKKEKAEEKRAEPEEALAPVVPLIPADPAWAAGPVPVPTGKPVEPTQAISPPVEPKPEVVEEASPAVAAAPAIVAAELPEPAAPTAEELVADLPPAAVQALVRAGKLPPTAPVIELPQAPPKPKKTDSPFELIASDDGFSLPPLALLQGGDEEARAEVDEALLHATADKLRQKLADFGIQGHVERIRPGPVVTMYEFAPAPGVKISKISGLSDDLAMALEALRVRIVAPIPGRGVVGIEVPNKKREIVYLREILEQDAFRKGASKLTMALGKDIEGMPFVADLARMPHVLISGTTGSGKSVSVNSMIMSLLFKSTPEEVRFIMVDPKMLELSIYEGIPHLLLPVVTDPRKAALALRWAVDEMERRYALLAENGVRDLASFNKLMGEKIKEREARGAAQTEEPASDDKVLIIDVEKGETEDDALERQLAEEPLDPVEAFLEKKLEEELEPRKLPYLVIIIDELADLMMVASKEVETYIARIAQKARAAGIHLMVATQRPSVDVVTGLIKANFPSRVSFLLRSRVDSQTILDQPGAEKLLGQGDMLILPPTSAHIQRVHGALVTEKEIKKVVDHLKAQGSPVYDESILKDPEAEGDGGMPDDDLSDELYDQAIAIVSEMKTVSISMLQRKMRIGYNRSARMIERMERDGIVGTADGAKPREVLIRKLGEMPGA